MKWAFRGRSTKFLGLALISLMLSSAVILWGLRQFLQQRRLVEHTQAILEQSESLLSLIKDAETGQRGYLLTREDRYLQPYKNAEQAIPKELENLRQLTQENPEQQQRIHQLDLLLRIKLGELEQTIQVRQQQDLAAALKIVQIGHGQQLMEQIRQQIQAIKTDENDRLQQRSQQAETTAGWVALTTILCSLLTFLLISIASFLLYQDQVKRQQAEKALGESEAQYRLLFDSNPHPMWVYDSDSLKFLAVNDSAIRQYGYSQTEFLDKTILDIHPVEEISVLKQTITAIKHRSDSFTATWQHHKRDGSLIDVEAVSYGIQFAEKAARLVLITDITQRKRAEAALQQAKAELEMRVAERTAELSRANTRLQQELIERQQITTALRESEAKFRSLNECSPIGIFMTDINGHCIYTNPRCQEICNFSFEQALGEGWVASIHPDDRTWVLDQKNQAFAENREALYPEVRFVQPDGTLRFGRIQTAPVATKAGKTIGFVGTIEDISASRAIEQMKNEFISIVSHELRTPLASIRGSLGLLASGILKNKPETAQQMLDIATSDTERLVRLVNDILDLERLEANQMNLNREWCNAADLMQRSLKTLQPIADKQNITLSLTPLDVQIWVDGDRIIQTLVNLLGNAIKFSPDDSTVTLSASLQELTFTNQSASEPCRPTPHVLFTVQDQGRGIPTDQLEKIFERFQQVDASDSRQKGGTGLGLAICRSIIQQHGGRIWVESVLDQGSTFYFSLPISPSFTAS
jgi:PAS domain S-box-containing protein